MNIEINISDYLSKEEIKEECKCTIRDLLIDNRLFRIGANENTLITSNK